MKKVLFFLLITSVCFSQQQVERFEVTPEGINQFVVVETTGSAEELFTKTKHWINTAFKNPERVMPRQIENEMIGGEMLFIEVIPVKGFVNGIFDMKVNYQINFKDDKLKFDIYWVEFPTSVPTSGVRTFEFSAVGGGYPSFYNLKGKPKPKFQEFVSVVEDKLNGLVSDLVNYIENNQQDDW